MMSEFPEGDCHFENVVTYEAEQVNAWFKRCMAEFPVDTYVPTDKEHVVRIVTPEYEDVEMWFEKWFSQFIENHEEEP